MDRGAFGGIFSDPKAGIDNGTGEYLCSRNEGGLLQRKIS